MNIYSKERINAYTKVTNVNSIAMETVKDFNNMIETAINTNYISNYPDLNKLFKIIADNINCYTDTLEFNKRRFDDMMQVVEDNMEKINNKEKLKIYSSMIELYNTFETMYDETIKQNNELIYRINDINNHINDNYIYKLLNMVTAVTKNNIHFINVCEHDIYVPGLDLIEYLSK